jgi:hypothetical protein
MTRTAITRGVLIVLVVLVLFGLWMIFTQATIGPAR